MNDSFVRDILHEAKHLECDGIKPGKDGKISTRRTEKRICRCMFYYGKDEEKCSACPLEEKYVLSDTSKYKIIDAEMPTIYKIEKCGGIDLVLEDSTSTYAVEVKPYYSTESIIRMIAEIYTYTIEPDFKDMVKSIAFFEDSSQHNYYDKYKTDPLFKQLFDKVTVFLIKRTKKPEDIYEFDFEKLNG